MHTNKHRARMDKRLGLHTDLWAMLTILAFPVALVTSSNLGIGVVRSFLYGALASLLILTLDFLFERQLWLFDPAWRARFDQPDFSFRLAVVSGAILLIVETLILILLFSNRSLDRAIVDAILNRECARPSQAFADLCQRLTNPY